MLRALVLSVILCLTGSLANADQTMIDQMLKPSALVSFDGGSGSATAVRVDAIMGTYLVTNYHVVQGNMDSLTVQFYGEAEKYPAYVHSIDVQNDIAVIITFHQHSYVAKIGKNPEVFDEVMCVGASLGAPLAPSRGIITGVNARMFGSRFFTRTDCDIAPGNSGGGLFAKQDGEWKYVGMPAAVATMPSAFSRIPMTFMGIAVRLQDIQLHLHENGVLNVAPVYAGTYPQ